MSGANEKGEKSARGVEKLANPGKLVEAYLDHLSKKLELESDLRTVQAKIKTYEDQFPALSQISGQVRSIVNGPVWSVSVESTGKKAYTIAKTEGSATERLSATLSGRLEAYEKQEKSSKRKAKEDIEGELQKRTKKPSPV